METEKQIFVIMAIIKLLSLTGRFTPSLHSIEVILMMDVLLRIIRSNSQNSHNTLKENKRCLVLVGVIVPCIFVGPAVFLDIYGDTYLSSGYGKQPLGIDMQ
jgi:hypothetical protein